MQSDPLMHPMLTIQPSQPHADHVPQQTYLTTQVMEPASTPGLEDLEKFAQAFSQRRIQMGKFSPKSGHSFFTF